MRVVGGGWGSGVMVGETRCNQSHVCIARLVVGYNGGLIGAASLASLLSSVSSHSPKGRRRC